MFDSDFFARNRTKLLASVDNDYPIIIAGNFLMQRNSDISYKFRQDSSFWYFTGLEHPGLLLYLSKDKNFVIVPKIDERRLIFEGSLDKEAMKTISGIEEVYDYDDGWNYINDILTKIGNVNLIDTSNIPNIVDGISLNPAKMILRSQISSKVKINDIKNSITKLRMVKQKEEIKAIKQAISVTTKIFNEIKSELKTFTNEKEINSLINVILSKNNLSYAYESIVANSINGCVLHYVQNNAKIDKNSLILIDAGAEFSNYASDITRTYALTRPTKRQKDVFESVLRVQNFAFELLKPGITIKCYENEVVKFMGEELKKLGLINENSNENVRKYFPHATSHHLGLDTHDIADYNTELQESMVLTVEPGIYIPEESIAIRIEDDVVIRKNGIEILSKSLSRQL